MAKKWLEGAVYSGAGIGPGIAAAEKASRARFKKAKSGRTRVVGTKSYAIPSAKKY